MRFHPETERVLRQAGWHPGRDVGNAQVALWVHSLQPLAISESALAVLHEFGGIQIPAAGAGLECAREAIDLTPSLARGEEDRFEAFGRALGQHLYPVGEHAGGHGFIAINEHGVTYVLMDAVMLAGNTMDEALDRLIRGRLLIPLGVEADWR